MNKTKIEWCDYTWNPLIGCRHGCKYCYAKRLNSRFNFIPKWETPIFFPDRLNEPLAKRKGAKIFVCSMSDLFGNWVRSEWIEKILHIACSMYHDIIPANALGLSTVWVSGRPYIPAYGLTTPVKGCPGFKVRDLQTLVSVMGLNVI